MLKKYDNKMKAISSNKNSFGAMVGPIMFLGMMATFSAPYLVNVSKPVSIITIIVSAGSMVLLEKLSNKIEALKEFSFPISMVLGMISACIITNIMGG